MLLDEPTNHLDIETIDRLKGFENLNGTIIFISLTIVRLFAHGKPALSISIVSKPVTYPGNYDQSPAGVKEALRVEELQKREFDRNRRRKKPDSPGSQRAATRNEAACGLKAMRRERSERREVMGNGEDAGRRGDAPGKITF